MIKSLANGLYELEFKLQTIIDRHISSSIQQFVTDMQKYFSKNAKKSEPLKEIWDVLQESDYSDTKTFKSSPITRYRVFSF
jgi:hypothetical protein